jgi:hypothetical protein
MVIFFNNQFLPRPPFLFCLYMSHVVILIFKILWGCPYQNPNSILNTCAYETGFIRKSFQRPNFLIFKAHGGDFSLKSNININIPSVNAIFLKFHKSQPDLPCLIIYVKLKHGINTYQMVYKFE